KFSASQEHPLKMYYADFDDNGGTETVLAYAKEGKYYPVLGLDELGSQMSFLKRKFTSYQAFAGKTIEEVFDKEQLANAEVLTVDELASGYLLYSGGKYTYKAFGPDLQMAPITAFLNYDFDGDGNEEVLIGGNYFGLSPYHGRLGSLAGNIIIAEGKILEGNHIGL